MADGSYQLARAVYTALTGDATVSGYVGTRVYDIAPHSQATFPYITLMDQSQSEWGADDFSGREHTLDIQVWSRPQKPHTKEARQIISAIADVLHNAALSVTDQDLVLLRFENSTVLMERDDQTILGVATYRAITCTTS